MLLQQKSGAHHQVVPWRDAGKLAEAPDLTVRAHIEVQLVMQVDELKDRFRSRIIIFDLPPVLVGDDVLAFSRIADAMLLVVQEGKTTTDDLNRAINLLDNKNLIGTVLNRSSVSNEFSNYGY